MLSICAKSWTLNTNWSEFSSHPQLNCDLRNRFGKFSRCDANTGRRKRCTFFSVDAEVLGSFSSETYKTWYADVDLTLIFKQRQVHSATLLGPASVFLVVFEKVQCLSLVLSCCRLAASWIWRWSPADDCSSFFRSSPCFYCLWKNQCPILVFSCGSLAALQFGSYQLELTN